MSAVIEEYATGSSHTVTTGYTTIDAAITDPGAYELHFDLTAGPADGVIFVFRVSRKVVSGGTAIAGRERVIQNAQTDKVMVFGPFNSLHEITFQVRRIGGSDTNHAFTIYRVLDDNVPAVAGDEMNLVDDAITAAKIDAAAITSASFAAGAITANVIAENAIGEAELAADAVAEIRDAILADSTPFNGADIAAILTDTGTTLPATLASIEGKVDTIDGIVDAILVDTDTTIPALIAAVPGAVWEELTASHMTAGTFGLALGTTLQATLSTIEGKIDIIDGIVDAILEDTGTTLPDLIGALPTTDIRSLVAKIRRMVAAQLRQTGLERKVE